MRNLSIYTAGKKLLLLALLLCSILVPRPTKAAGVTIITHGYDGLVTGWVAAMADEIPSYFHSRYSGLGTNFTIYTITLTTDGSNYYYKWTRDSGSSPSNTANGEIIVKLDWSQMSGGFDPYELYDISTYDVATVVSYVLLQTNTIADLGGHSLAEYPIHLIGHSRGGSLMNEVSRILGTNGVWIDHLTTLDPHPFNNDGNIDLFFPTDASASNTYANVLFRDNYWQILGVLLDPHGESALGAYDRQLYDLSEGYNNTNISSPDHSNVHLWYHGTINLNTPASYNYPNDTATIDATMRTNWWVPYEEEGIVAGFYYSLIGGGNRLSTDRPLGLPEDPAIVDGYNQNWDLGAGSSNPNRTALTSNNGTWPNIIKFDVIGTNVVIAGNPISTKLYYQYGGSSNLTAQIYFDQDFNPYNSNNISALLLQPPITGTGSVFFYSNLGIATTNILPGVYSIYAKISDGKHTRYLYSPELVQIKSALQPPALIIKKSGSAQLIIEINGLAGQKIALQSSSDLQRWVSLATNTVITTGWSFTNNMTHSVGSQFYRAILVP